MPLRSFRRLPPWARWLVAVVAVAAATTTGFGFGWAAAGLSVLAVVAGAAAAAGRLSIAGSAAGFIAGAASGGLLAPLTVPIGLLGFDHGWIRRTLIWRGPAIRLLLIGFVLSVGAIGGVIGWRSMQPAIMLVDFGIPDWLPTGPVALWVIVATASLANAIYEELLWRAWLPRLIPARRWPWAAIITSSGFALAHVDALPHGVLGVGLTFLFGMAASWAVKASRGNLLPAIAAHFAADVVLLASVMGLIHVPL